MNVLVLTGAAVEYALKHAKTAGRIRPRIRFYSGSEVVFEATVRSATGDVSPSDSFDYADLLAKRVHVLINKVRTVNDINSVGVIDSLSGTETFYSRRTDDGKFVGDYLTACYSGKPDYRAWIDRIREVISGVRSDNIRTSSNTELNNNTGIKIGCECTTTDSRKPTCSTSKAKAYTADAVENGTGTFNVAKVSNNSQRRFIELYTQVGSIDSHNYSKLIKLEYLLFLLNYASTFRLQNTIFNDIFDVIYLNMQQLARFAIVKYILYNGSGVSPDNTITIDGSDTESSSIISKVIGSKSITGIKVVVKLQNDFDDKLFNAQDFQVSEKIFRVIRGNWNLFLDTITGKEQPLVASWYDICQALFGVRTLDGVPIVERFVRAKLSLLKEVQSVKYSFFKRGYDEETYYSLGLAFTLASFIDDVLKSEAGAIIRALSLYDETPMEFWLRVIANMPLLIYGRNVKKFIRVSDNTEQLYANEYQTNFVMDICLVAASESGLKQFGMIPCILSKVQDDFSIPITDGYYVVPRPWVNISSVGPTTPLHDYMMCLRTLNYEVRSLGVLVSFTNIFESSKSVAFAVPVRLSSMFTGFNYLVIGSNVSGLYEVRSNKLGLNPFVFEISLNALYKIFIDEKVGVDSNLTINPIFTDAFVVGKDYQTEAEKIPSLFRKVNQQKLQSIESNLYFNSSSKVTNNVETRARQSLKWN